MSEELLQRDLLQNPEKIGKWGFYNIGATSVKALKEHGIIQKKDYKNFERRKPDGIITSKKNVIGIIENKSVSKFKTKRQKEDAYKQGLDVAQILNAKILILTDTIDTIWINALNGDEILDEKGRPLRILFNPKNQDLEKLIEQIIDSIDKTNSQIKEPRLKDPTRLAKSIWQDLWMVAGATPENCLYSFVELFIFKYLSDLGILKDHKSYDFLMKMFETDNEQVVLEYYADQIRKHIKKDLFPVTTEDNTTIINGTIFVSKDEKAVEGYGTVFKKVLKKFGDEKEGGGELKNIDKDFKSKLFETFLKESISKKNWGQYFTPLKVVRAIVKMAESDIKPDITICDPACGVGKFLLEPLLINNNIEDFYQVKNGQLKSKIKLIGIDKGFDKEEQKTIILAKANMLIYMSDLIRKHSDITPQFSNIFNDTFELKTKNILGTLRDISYEGTIDLILTNPPYVTTGSSNLKEEIVKSGLQSHYKINAMGVEGLFMEWIIRALKPGGKGFIIVPDGIFNRQNDKNLRQYILDECILDGIISLPLNTFFTTNKKTYILAITKKKRKTEKQTDPVFAYLASEIGESRDIYRFDIEQNDLDTSIDYFNSFKGNKKGFSKINNDKRCKVFGIKDFVENIEKSWIIDKWWSEEEKIELGISEKRVSVGVFDFALMVEDIANSIKNFEDEIKELAEKKKDNVKFQTFKVIELFKIEKGKSKYTRKYGDLNKGNFPVYSASNFEPLTHINSFDYDGEFLTWSTNGFAGYVKIVSDKFSINGDRGLLIPKSVNLNLIYIKNFLQPLFRNLAKGRKGEKGEDEFTKVYPSMIENIEILMPIDENGNFDIEAQNLVVEKIVSIEEIKSEISEYKKQIDELNVEIIDENEFKEISINDVFDFTRGRVISKADLRKNLGNYPVYSSNTKEDGVFGYLNSFDFDCEGITWTTDGIYAGTTFYRKGKFSITNVCGLITIKKEFSSQIYMPFINEILNFRSIATGTDNKKVMTNVVRSSNISLKIPINSKGEFDLVAQKEITEKYKKIEQIKKSISQELDKITIIEIDYE